MNLRAHRASVVDLRADAQRRRPLGRDALRPFIGKAGPRGELAGRLTKQATGKIIGVSDAAVRVLEGWF